MVRLYGQDPIVKDYICGVRQRRREMFVPLAPLRLMARPAVIGGVERKTPLPGDEPKPHSDACFVKAYPGETTEACLSAMSRGSPSSAVCRARSFMTHGPHPRFSGHVCSLRSHYLFEDRFQGQGDPRLLTSWSMPRFRMISTRISLLRQAMGGTTAWPRRRRSANARDRAVLQRLPATPTTPATSARGGSVRCRWCAIAAPITPGNTVRPRGAPRLSTRWSSVAPQTPGTRVHTSMRTSSDPRTICPSSKRRNALDQATLPPVFGDLRRLLEARMGKAVIQVLRLIESFSLDDVRAPYRVIGFDAVKHRAVGSRSGRHRLNLLDLPRAEVEQPRRARTWGS